jgi:hypothetical protein
MLRWGIAGVLPALMTMSCGGSSGGVAPQIVAVSPKDGAANVWLHEPIVVTFSEAVDPAAVDVASLSLRDDAGNDLQGAVTLSDDGLNATVRAADAATALGEISLQVAQSITDAAGRPLIAGDTFHWRLAPWSSRSLGQIAESQVPSIGVAGNTILVARSVETASGHRVVVTDDSGKLLGGALGTDAVMPVIAVDADGRPIVAWQNIAMRIIEAARWNGAVWIALPSPGAGSFPVLASSPQGQVGIAWVNAAGDVAVAVLSAAGAWQTLANTPIDATLVVGRPALAIPQTDSQVVAFIDQTTSTGVSNGPLLDVRVTALPDSGVALPPLRLADVPPGGEINRVSIDARGSNITVAWDEYSGHSMSAHVAQAANGGWTIFPELNVDPPGDARAPDVHLDADGIPLVAWAEQIEGAHRGFVARWTGTAWQTVGGDTWTGSPDRAPVWPQMALFRGRAPVVVWSDFDPAGSSSRIARFNGPGTPRLGIGTRAPLDGCAIDIVNPPLKLSATGCFTIVGGAAMPHAGLVPYDVVSELWSDGALKRRWLALPAGGLTLTANGSFDAPVGSFIIKEFAIGDPAARTIMETRFLARDDVGWHGFSYQWRSDGSDADLLPGAAPTIANWPDGTGTHTHSYPSRGQCLRCHNATVGPLLGVRPEQLARRFDYGGVLDEQLRTLKHIAVIAPDVTGISLPAPHDPRESLERRVRGYLAINCSHCHNPLGERPTRDFRINTPLANTHLCEGEITPGSPGTSLIVTRVSARPGMPPLATLRTDPLLLNVLPNWITSLVTCP